MFVMSMGCGVVKVVDLALVPLLFLLGLCSNDDVHTVCRVQNVSDGRS